MSVSPSDFLQSAKEFATSTSEISKRNGLSRAYYAAYHLSSEKFPLDENFTPTNLKAGAHRKYISYLETFAAGSLQRIIGVHLNKLYSKRIKADYKLSENINPSDLALQLAGTDQIFYLIESN
jgi:hypothetical protein